MEFKKPELFHSGHHLSTIPLPEDLRAAVQQENWNEVDQYFQHTTAKDGELFQYLSQFHEFTKIEFIISVRDSENSWEEDGIWHDDGSRVFAFSLSLTEQKIEGGQLAVKKKNSDEISYIPTPSFGSIILFLTGVHGYEHKIHQVIRGRRVIIAGWCS